MELLENSFLNDLCWLIFYRFFFFWGFKFYSIVIEGMVWGIIFVVSVVLFGSVLWGVSSWGWRICVIFFIFYFFWLGWWRRCCLRWLCCVFSVWNMISFYSYFWFDGFVSGVWGMSGWWWRSLGGGLRVFSVVIVFFVWLWLWCEFFIGGLLWVFWLFVGVLMYWFGSFIIGCWFVIFGCIFGVCFEFFVYGKIGVDIFGFFDGFFLDF